MEFIGCPVAGLVVGHVASGLLTVSAKLDSVVRVV
jgi:hypothetical protein